MSPTNPKKPSPHPAAAQPAQNHQVPINVARKEGHAFRGALLDHFARIERSLGPLLVQASTLPAYATIAKKPAHLLGQKLEQLRKLAGAEGPLKKSLTKVATNIEALHRYEEMRHFMAHATLEVVQGENGDLLYLFRLARLNKGSVEHSSIVLGKAEAKVIGTELGAVVHALTQQLDATCKDFRTGISRPPRGTALPQGFSAQS